MERPHFHGHRSRLRDRFDQAGIDGLNDYELLELLLTFVHPRKDTKPVAKRLLARFGSVGGVLHASPSRLHDVCGVGKETSRFISLVRETASLALRERIERRSSITNRRDVETYLRFNFGHLTDEYIAALFLDNQNNITGCEILAEGTVNQCALYPRRVVERAFNSGAAALILAHNHPGGTLEPSRADWDITGRLQTVCAHLDIAFHDHLIISRDGVVSLRELAGWKRKGS